MNGMNIYVQILCSSCVWETNKNVYILFDKQLQNKSVQKGLTKEVQYGHERGIISKV